MEVSPFDIMQELISAGHSKNAILNEYSMAEVKMFYEKSIRKTLSARADFIEGVIAGIGGAFSDKNAYKKNIVPLLESLRGE